MNIPTLIVLLIVAAVVGLVIWKMVKDKKAGKSACDSCGNAGCCMSRSELKQCDHPQRAK